ncbi:hypothetical protein FVA95_25390 [Pseudonocardia sp. EV170527-09]|uniref:hypothetical protein n=1 Tax=Pseudonocardia sp. EV170527-09 TaxID=2603411 RepID=UPI0011F11443|nr:hypothetical protein [Pseudonocardia sp. EV170527-09]KAA1016538.1 hypothetical protein FVA95_25390 [Pseudonocardia sp. EV170527-09]
MRESALVARPDEHGHEVLVAYRPVHFTLDDTARAMNAVVDPHLRKVSSRARVGRSRVRDVLRQIATDGWPDEFVADPDRVDYWRNWLVAQGVFQRDD